MKTSHLKNTTVDLAGLLTVLSENLYSRPEVAIRELVQNASDAISRRRLTTADEFVPRIDISANPDNQTITIIDNGSGLTADEIDLFLARIGSGFTRSIKSDDDNLIGAFGLGFLTAYMIGKKVVVTTTSVSDPATGYKFVSENGQKYITNEVKPTPVGTQITISLKDKYQRLSEYDELIDVLDSYCALMIVPVHVNGAPESINITPPWRVESPDEPVVRIRARRMDFAELVEPRLEPICTIPITPYKNQKSAGLLWIHGSTTYGGADNRWMQVYVRGMMVCDNKRRLLPSWAGFVSGVYESWSLSPTASREDIQENDDYQAQQKHIADCLVTGLANVARDQPTLWSSILHRHNEALLGAAIADQRLFDVLKDDLRIPTTEGDLSLAQIAEQSAHGITVTTHTDGGADELVARAFGVPVALGYRYGVLATIKRYANEENIKLVELGTKDGHNQLFPAAKVTAETETALRDLFDVPGHSIEFAKFSPDYLSVIAVVDKEQRLKAYFESDEADLAIGAGMLGLARATTKTIKEQNPIRLVVNVSSPLVQTLANGNDTVAKSTAGALLAYARLLVKRSSLDEDGFSGAMASFHDHLLNIQECHNG